MTRRRFTGEEEAELRRLHALGCSWSEIGRALGRDPWTVNVAGRRLGLPSNCAPGRPGGANRERIERIREMRRAGASLREIASEVGVTHQAVSETLARWGS